MGIALLHSHPQRSLGIRRTRRILRHHCRRCPLFGRRHVPQRPRHHHRVVYGECGALRRTTARHSHRCVERSTPQRIVHLQHLYLQHRRKRGDDRFPPKKFGAIPLTVDIDPAWNITPALVGDLPAYRFMPHRTRGEGLFMAILRKPGEPGETQREALLSTAEKTEKRNKKIKHPE